jgi:ATP-dependent RNA helicase DeaD
LFKQGRDICALAETGSGKTSACAIPLVEKIERPYKGIQGLVLVPTRELAIQYVTEIQKVAAFTDIVAFPVYGGFDKDIQRAKIKHGVDIVVATPGRLIDLIYEGNISLAQVRCFILDEADQLLNDNFLDDIKLIFSCMVHEHQTAMFSATMPDVIKVLAHDCMKDAEHITLISQRAAPVSISHGFAYVRQEERYKALIEYAKHENVDQMFIFCNARHQVDKLCKSMRDDLHGVEFVHAGLTQEKRTSLFMKLRDKKIKYLIATDVAGRGLDFSGVSHVVNWDMPWDGEQYMHRTGRTGRMSRKGKALTFVGNRDLAAVQRLMSEKGIVPQWLGKDPFAAQPTKDAQPHERKGAHAHHTQHPPAQGKEVSADEGEAAAKKRRRRGGRGRKKPGEAAAAAHEHPHPQPKAAHEPKHSGESGPKKMLKKILSHFNPFRR